MPVYTFACACGHGFDAKRPVEERHACACPACGGWAHRQFRPEQVMIQTPAHLATIRADYQPLSTPQHSSDYLAQAVLERHCDGMHQKQQEARKGRQSFAEFFAQRHPDQDLNQRLTPAETREVKAALGATPHA